MIVRARNSKHVTYTDAPLQLQPVVFLALLFSRHSKAKANRPVCRHLLAQMKLTVQEGFSTLCFENIQQTNEIFVQKLLFFASDYLHLLDLSPFRLRCAFVVFILP